MPDTGSPDRPSGAFRSKLYVIIFEADTFWGRAFDLALIWLILASVSVAVLESIPALRAGHMGLLHGIEWGFTLLFTSEYLLRIYSHARPWRYAFSFFGIVDLLSILPTYLSVFLPGGQVLAVIRVFRTLRLFRIFKLIRYMREARVLLVALQGSWPKIMVFLVAMSGIVITMGTLMYLVEGEPNGFTSIPKGIYWAVITLTTVGYGDLVPRTVAGQTIATLVMILGYSIIAVPTGIVGVEIAQATRTVAETTACPSCGKTGHEADAKFCRICGASLLPMPGVAFRGQARP
jgi:voltage-gated potassium channel